MWIIYESRTYFGLGGLGKSPSSMTDAAEQLELNPFVLLSRLLCIFKTEDKAR